LPVLDNGKLIGVLTDEDIMRFAFGHLDRLSAPVKEAMQTAFISVPKEMAVKSLVSILQVAPYAVVLDGERFLGLITRSDVLNYLRREVQS
jgi:cystathionine beta-synthase